MSGWIDEDTAVTSRDEVCDRPPVVAATSNAWEEQDWWTCANFGVRKHPDPQAKSRS